MFDNEIQGAQAELDALSVMSKACEVLAPVGFRHTPYDAVFINSVNGKFEKMQVKSSSAKANGSRKIKLVNDRGAHYATLGVDYIFAVYYDYSRQAEYWLIPTHRISNKNSISLSCNDYAKYKIDTSSIRNQCLSIESILTDGVRNLGLSLKSAECHIKSSKGVSSYVKRVA